LVDVFETIDAVEDGVVNWVVVVVDVDLLLI
jgi:hypothetical protein